MAAPIPGSMLWEVFYGKSHFHALCWKLSLSQSRNVYYWTEWSLPLLLFDGQTYSPQYGMDSTAKDETSGLVPGEKSGTGFNTVTTLGLSADEIKRGALRGATLDEYLIDIRTPWVAPIDYKQYFVSKATFDDSIWTVQCDGLVYPMQDQVGEYWGPICRSELFDQGRGKCNANILQFTTVAMISGIINQGYQFEVLHGGAPFDESGYCDDGKIFFNGGFNGNGTYSIKRWVVPGSSGAAFAEVWLNQRTLKDFSVGDGLTIYPGCNKYLFHCKDRYQNVVNYQAEPWIPGGDRATQGRPTPI